MSRILFESFEDGAPEFTVKALLDFGDRTNEGVLIQAVALPWFSILGRIQRNPQEAYSIDSRTWEEIELGLTTTLGSMRSCSRPGAATRAVTLLLPSAAWARFASLIKSRRTSPA